MAGYSGTPLVNKLSIKSGDTVYLANAPEGFEELLEPLPDDVTFVKPLAKAVDFIHCFTTDAPQLAASGSWKAAASK